MEKSTVRGTSIYQPVCFGASIRILEIFSGRFDDPLIGRFQNASIKHSCLDFQALSYVWKPGKFYVVKPDKFYYGHGTGESTMNCDSHDLTITPSLERALRHIRSNHELKRIWVDALCINQKDNEERSYQVLMMSSIYRKATKVVIWIGSPKRSLERFYRREPEESAELQAQKAFTAVCYLVNKWQGGSHAERARFSFYLNENKGIDDRPGDDPKIWAEHDCL